MRLVDKLENSIQIYPPLTAMMSTRGVYCSFHVLTDFCQRWVRPHTSCCFEAFETGTEGFIAVFVEVFRREKTNASLRLVESNLVGK